MAPGAAWRGRHVVAHDGMRIALTGMIVGFAAAAGLTHLMASLLYDVKPTDIETSLLPRLASRRWPHVGARR